MDTFTKQEVLNLLKVQAELHGDSLEALFEVLNLSQEQIDTFNKICTEKMYERHDKKNSTTINGKTPINNPQ